MSAYVTLATPMTDRECLEAALVEVGVPSTVIKQSETAMPLRGWQGNQTAHVIIPKEHTGDAFNDIGFRHTTAGYVAIISNDHPRFGRAWITAVNQAYRRQEDAKRLRLEEAERLRIEAERRQRVEFQRQSVYDRAKKMGYQVQETREGDSIRLVLLKRSY